MNPMRPEVGSSFATIAEERAWERHQQARAEQAEDDKWQRLRKTTSGHGADCSCVACSVCKGHEERMARWARGILLAHGGKA